MWFIDIERYKLCVQNGKPVAIQGGELIWHFYMLSHLMELLTALI